MNPKISVVVFDLGNVLLPFDYSIAVNRLNAIAPRLGDRFYAYNKGQYNFHRSFERGDVSNEDFITTMLTELNNKLSSESFCRIYSEIFTENTAVTSLLPSLKKNYKLFLLSNTNAIHQEYGWKNYSFLQYFERLILSHEVNSVKPEQKIYKEVEKYSCLPSSEHIFIDDVFEYAEAAKNNGWQAINYKTPELLKSEFDQRGILYYE